VVLFALYHYVSRSVRVERWADSARAHRLQRVRDDLHSIREDLEHPSDWRPVILAFSDDPARRERLMRFSSWLEGGAGFTTVLRIDQGSGAVARRDRRSSELELEAEIRRQELDAFARVVLADDVEQAVPVVLQSYGLGRVRPNTVILNWYDRNDSQETLGLAAYSHYVRLALRFDCNVVLLAARRSDFEAIEAIRPHDRAIDVWYQDDAGGRLMLLLAYLLTRSEPFGEAKLRLFATANGDETDEQARRRLKTMLDEVRIEAELEIVAQSSAATVLELSKHSAVVFQPFRLKQQELISVFDGDLEDVVRDLGVVALVLASQDIELQSDPEGGRHAELAAAVDTLERAARRARKAESEAEAAAKAAAQARAQLADPASDPERRAEAEETLAQAEQQVEKARRRAAREQAKVRLGEQEVAALGGAASTENTTNGDER
jgi:hypothetical protein